jgi:DNA helicase-2/ATP-dependent DNA helicase PcrA
MLPQRFHVHQQTSYGDHHVYASRSRFIPDAIAGLFDACAWPEPKTEEGGAKPPRDGPIRPIDLSARVRALWR